MSLLDRVLKRKATAQAASRPVSMSIAKAQAGHATRYDWNNIKEFSYLIQDTIAGCISLRASERSTIKFEVLDNGKASPTATKLQHCIDYPNPVTARTELLNLISQHLDVNGNALLVLVGDGDTPQVGIPSEMYLMPSWDFVVLDERRRPIQIGQEYTVPAWYQWNDVVIPAANVLHIRRPSIKSAPFKGRGILMDSMTLAQTYDAVLRAQKRYFDTDGLPNAAIQFPQGVTTADINATELRATWRERFNPKNGDASLAIVPDGGELVFPTLAELGFAQSKQDLRDSIRELFQVPKIMFGDTDSVNFNNGVTSMAIFRHAVVQRFGDQIADVLQKYFQDNVSPTITVTRVPDAAPEMPTDFTKGTPSTAELDPAGV